MNKIITLLFSSVVLTYSILNPAIAAGYFGAAIGSADVEGADDSSIKIFGGYRQNNLGFEVAYHDLGKQEESSFGATASAEITGLELSGVGYLPLSPTFDLFGKIGLFSWDADLAFTGFQDVSVDGSDLIFGLGAQYNPSEKTSIRLEYQTTTLDVNGVDFDTDIISVGVAFNF